MHTKWNKEAGIHITNEPTGDYYNYYNDYRDYNNPWDLY